jgi:hypothetical protein
MIENPADFYYGVLWNKMYRRSIIEEYHIRMDTSISWCEDFLFNLEYIRHAESFFALQVPIYYYLKRRGSLVSQGASITNTVRMKSNIFEYYNEFYKDVYEDKDYADIRLQVYSFLPIGEPPKRCRTAACLREARSWGKSAGGLPGKKWKETAQ